MKLKKLNKKITKKKLILISIAIIIIMGGITT
ncbi:unnamed protein product, partial [marine sediment metagenome]